LINGSCLEGHGIKGDAWFSSVQTAIEIGAHGGETVLQVKGNKGLYPKDFIEENLKDALGGVPVVLTGIASNGFQLIAVGYRYSVKTTSFFVMTENAASTKPGDPYMMKYTDSYDNICSREVEHPAVISDFFAESNTIDDTTKADNMTKSMGYRRLLLPTYLLNDWDTCTDSWKLADYHTL